MSLEEKVMSLSPEQKTVYMVMRTHGTTLKTIYENTPNQNPLSEESFLNSNRLDWSLMAPSEDFIES